jgi:hypothetical protein
MPSIFVRMSPVAAAVCPASSLISFATTAKPLPAAPALAASMVAFSASRFVCAEMAEIVCVTAPTSSAARPSSCITSAARAASVVASALIVRARSELRATSPIVALIS